MSQQRTTTSSGTSLTAGLFEAPPFAVPNLKGETFKLEIPIYREASPDIIAGKHPSIRTEKRVWWYLDDDDRNVFGIDPATGKPFPAPHNHPWSFLSKDQAEELANDLKLDGSSREDFIIRVTGQDLLQEFAGRITLKGEVIDDLTGISFISVVGSGGYTSVTYTKTPNFDCRDEKSFSLGVEERLVQAGEIVAYPFNEYHLVKNVLVGRTAKGEPIPTRTHMICGPATPGNHWGYLNPNDGSEHPFGIAVDKTFMDRMLGINPWRRTDERVSQDEKREQLHKKLVAWALESRGVEGIDQLLTEAGL